MTELISLILAATLPLLSFDKTVHDFGTISIKDGPVSCSFEVRNDGQEPLLIEMVTTTCGCTKVEWTRKTIAPGASGTISVVYSNDEGPQLFDKTLKVYTNAEPKPRVLHLRGNVVRASYGGTKSK